MYELFYKPIACSRAVHVLFHEMGVPFTLTSYEHKERLHSYNPRAQVPTLVVDGEPILEGAAILTYLADTHQSPLLPASGLARAKALQWLAFANSSLHPIYSAFFHGGEAYAQSQFGKSAQTTLQQLWDMVEAQLEKTPYLAGEQMSLGDILTTVIAHWTPFIKTEIVLGPKTQALVKTVSQRPSYVKAVEAEQPSKKSAA